ncbi:uncharacterized protein LOC117649303 [Thrips palmi]|uniref:Uncharacterized protein LOC117649303 n=1 Tax=Thrips palmi TaxID=161013 RepID=A0A6P8ZRL8_THRPL|nr:uncharacterized protein LOC117649303 [Thrips palmi]
MTRTLLVVLALVASACAADNYAFNQIDELFDRIQVCLKPVPQRGFSYPATDCAYNARNALRHSTKESQADSIASCLLNYRDPVNAAVVATAKQCLSESLAKPVQPALKKASYNIRQLDVIESRIKACQSGIVETATSTPAASCRFEARVKAGKGYPKESLVDFLVPCLTGRNIDATIVSEAQACIAASLAKPL